MTVDLKGLPIDYDKFTELRMKQGSFADMLVFGSIYKGKKLVARLLFIPLFLQ